MIECKISRVILCFFLINFLACESNIQNKVLNIHRFENEFYNSSEEELHLLINKYPYLFPKEFPIETWKSFLKDSTKLAVFKETSKVFGDFKIISEEISQVFSNSNEIFAEFIEPKIITLTSQSDYENRIIYADSLLLISLDSYLGKNYYPSLPDYISSNMTKEYISNDISELISKYFIDKSNDRTLLSEMIYHGKILYLNRQLTPFNKEYLIFHSSFDKIKWADENEFNIWSFFIENDFLFSTRNDLKSRFISFSPFSKFNLDIDKKSPGSIGKWLGYKIVNSFMKNNNIDLKDLLNQDYYHIYINSKYKPKK
jgi:hypothetical protein|tara:strand:- start:2756 stop:3697 length:942 start_codon:yes stop_codon:yes gene_type:complete